MKPPEQKFRARFVVSVAKTVTYVDVPAPTLAAATKAAKKFPAGAASVLVEEYANGHWTLRVRKTKP